MNIGFPGLLFLLFLALRLCHVISWSWVWVFAPLWIGIGITVLALGLAFVAKMLSK